MSVDALAESQASAAPRRRKGLALKFALAFLGLVTFVLVVNGAVNLWLSYEEAKRSAVRVQQEKAQAAAERINLFVSDIEQQMGWTTRAEWARVSLDQRRYDFIRLLRQAPAITELVHIDGNGKEQLRLSRLEPDVIGSGVDYSTRQVFTGAVANKSWFGPVYFRRGSEPYMTIGVAHAGRNPGVTMAEVNLKLIWDVVSSIRIGNAGYAFIVDAQGRLVAHPDMSLVLRETDLAKLPPVAAALASRDTHTDANTAATTTGLDGSSVLVAYAPIPRLNWLVFVQLPTRESLAPVYASLTQTGALLGLGLVLATVMGGFLARRLVIPIQQLQAGAQRLGEGDLSQRINVNTGDEIETLARRFNTMAGRIQEAQETLESKVEARTRDLNEALAQQTATSEVLRVISQSPTDVNPVFDAIVEAAVRLLRTDLAFVSLTDGKTVTPVAGATSSGRIEEMVPGRPVEPDEHFPSQAIVSKATLQFSDWSQIELPPHEQAIHERFGICSSMYLPLLRGEECVGVLIFASSRARAFTVNEIALAESFRDQAMIAIENTRLFNETKEALETQTATGNILRVIAASPTDIKPVLDAVAKSASTLCGAYDCAVLLSEGPDAVFKAHYGAIPIGLDKWPINRNWTVGRAIVDRKPVHIHDLQSSEGDDLPEGREMSIRMGHRTILSVPLTRDGDSIGAIVVRRREVHPFNEKQIELLKNFADQAVIAISNVRLFEEVQARTQDLTRSLEELRTTQDRLIQSEKLASLGQLTAGIAHEIKNPLNFVNNFAALSGELLEELDEALEPVALDEAVREEIAELTGMLKGNLAKVVQHGKRADSIVKNMLLHSREGSGDHRLVNINAIVEESVNLAYHGARAEKPGFNITLVKNLDPAVGELDLYPQEITRVFLNLITNGFYAAAKRKSEAGEADFEPTLTATTRNLGDKVEIRIRDNGTGIPADVKAKMFNPFFTTKPAGEGTGLGLSLSHDIVVKQHGGTIDVDSTPGAFTEFTVTLPRILPAASGNGQS